ncbi:MAG TPA: Crp/Fnr family transcriptional regulator [Actinomycetota bacterium]|nr:Crp/Fnr family transcriptional regulator [Actinomycetota bacterium]
MVAEAGVAGGFAGALAVPDLEALRAAGRSRRYPAGTTMLLEGDRSANVILIEDGRVKISSFTEDGREIVLAVRVTGDLLGELSVIDGEPLSATASALEDVRATVVPADAFKQYLSTHAPASFALLEIVSRRLRDADRKRIEFGAYDSVGRVARRLLELAERFGEGDGDGAVRIALPLSQEEIAGWTGSSREAVSKALRALRERNVIDTARKVITVLDMDALRKRAT